jgi:hypothetical protein
MIKPFKILSPHTLIIMVFANDPDSGIKNYIRIVLAIYGGVSKKEVLVDGIDNLIIKDQKYFNQIYDTVVQENNLHNYIISSFHNFIRKGNQLRVTYRIDGKDKFSQYKKFIEYYIFYNIVEYELIFDHYERKVER